MNIDVDTTLIDILSSNSPATQIKTSHSTDTSSTRPCNSSKNDPSSNAASLINYYPPEHTFNTFNASNYIFKPPFDVDAFYYFVPNCDDRYDIFITNSNPFITGSKPINAPVIPKPIGFIIITPGTDKIVDDAFNKIYAKPVTTNINDTHDKAFNVPATYRIVDNVYEHVFNHPSNNAVDDNEIQMLDINQSKNAKGRAHG